MDEIPALGIELSEVLRPASSSHGILPVEQESFHKEIITKAQQDYYDGRLMQFETVSGRVMVKLSGKHSQEY